MDSQAQAQPPRPATKTAGLTNILNNDEQSNPPHQLRDSGFYSTAEASSKRTSPARLLPQLAPSCALVITLTVF